MKYHYIPVLTSEAGACLTWANWEEIGIATVAYYLADLLMKPGFSLLDSLPDLRSYCGWQGGLVLNASLPVQSDGVYAVRSHYDGSIIHISADELFSLIVRLQADLVILPAGFTGYLRQHDQAVPNTQRFFIPADEFLSMPPAAGLGCYLVYDRRIPFTEFIQHLQKYEGQAIYLTGEFELSQLCELAEQGIMLIESDKPAADAFAGQVYTSEGSSIALLDSQMAHQYERIDAQCGCPTCQQGFTRAYLHHLLMHTPLLCQRFLIQHNASCYQRRSRGYNSHIGK